MIPALRRIAFVLVLATGPVWVAAPSEAGCEWTTVTQTVNGQIRINQVYQCSGNSGDGTTTTDVSSIDPPRNSDLDTACVRNALTIGLDPLSYCDIPGEVAETIALTSGIVAAAFARIPLPPSELVIQPPNGRTLVNFDTNFYTEAVPFMRTVTLLGQRVDLNITPASFGWRFGDGESASTTSPGSAYPDLEITHSYLRKGRVSPRVDTTYTATFRVGGGPWRPVPGSVTIPGPAVGLQVVTARPQLVG